jgi:GNAT superfamily N-acetyltransferase
MSGDGPGLTAKVRDAVAGDAPAVRAVASAAWRDTYAGLLADATIESFIASAYSVERLERRIAGHTFLVVEEGGAIVAFADAIRQAEHVTLAAIYAHPARRGRGAGSALLSALRKRFPELPVAADVVEGNRKGEVFYERRGFAPRERLEEELYGEPVVEVRWWLGSPPSVER